MIKYKDFRLDNDVMLSNWYFSLQLFLFYQVFKKFIATVYI